MTRLVPKSIAVVAVALCSFALSSPARAEVVFGNLGADGLGGISSTATDIGPGAPTVRALAQGFTTGTGSTKVALQSVTIGAFATTEGTLPRTISIFSNSSGDPGSVLFTSAATNVGNTGKYSFGFSGATLATGTSYWVVPDFSVDWTWNLEADDADQPSEQNASGYSYLGTRRQTASNPGVWANSTLPYSLSIQAAAVPEPSTYALAAVGIGLAGFVWSRRRKAVV